MRKNANTDQRKGVHKEFVSNLNNLQQCMAKQDVMEQAYASDSEDGEEQKEPEKKGGFFGKIFGSADKGSSLKMNKKKKAAP